MKYRKPFNDFVERRFWLVVIMFGLMAILFGVSLTLAVIKLVG